MFNRAGADIARKESEYEHTARINTRDTHRHVAAERQIMFICCDFVLFDHPAALRHPPNGGELIITATHDDIPLSLREEGGRGISKDG